MPRVAFKGLNGPHKGLWVSGGKESTPPGGFRRFKGVSGVRSNSIRSRDGSTLLHALNSHSLTRFDDVRFQGAGGNLYRAGASILSGLNGSRLSLVRMSPQAGLQDYLFVAGGGLQRKVSPAGAVSNWGIAAPSNGFTAAIDPISTTPISEMDQIETVAGWTASAGVALANEVTIIQGPASGSLRMTVNAGILGTATKAVAYDATSVPEEGYITVWILIDNPLNVDYLQVAFDVGAGNFATDFYSAIIRRTDEPTPQDQQTIQTFGLGSLSTYQSNQDQVVDPDGAINLPPQSSAVYEGLGQTTFPSQSTWIKLRIPKPLFTRAGTGAGTWANIAAMKLAVKTNSRGAAIVYWDSLRPDGKHSLIGSYKYHITYKNSVTGSRSNANPTPVEISGLDRYRVILSGFVPSADAQVDKIEIWRTIGDGVLFFKVVEIADTTATYTDNIPDFLGLNSSVTTSLENVELPTDNAQPASTYSSAFGPFNAAMWWCRDSVAGAKGRVYYSPIGRPESVKGFLQVTNDDDPTQVGAVWNGNAYVFSEAHVFQIVGTDPYISREVYGVPGTINPDTMKATPFGIVYEAVDGVRVFNGVASALAGFEGVGVIFRGITSEGLTWGGGVTSAFGRDEYYISDGIITLALNLTTLNWRNLGLGCTALYFEEDSGELVGSFGGNTYILEDEGTLTDNGTAIAFEIEPSATLVDTGNPVLVQRLYVDILTNGQSITPTLLLDGASIALPVLSTASRQTVEYALNRTGKVISLRLSGSLSNVVEVYNIEADVYAPAAVQEATA